MKSTADHAPTFAALFTAAVAFASPSVPLPRPPPPQGSPTASEVGAGRTTTTLVTEGSARKASSMSTTSSSVCSSISSPEPSLKHRRTSVTCERSNASRARSTSDRMVGRMAVAEADEEVVAAIGPE